MMIKSALMTTAYDVLDGPNTNPLVIFRQGAGPREAEQRGRPRPGLQLRLERLARPSSAARSPGLRTCTRSGAPGLLRDPSDFNVASIAIADLAGAQTVNRTRHERRQRCGHVHRLGHWPRRLHGRRLARPASRSTPGQTKAFTVTFTRTTAALNTYAGGYVIWTDGKGHVVRIPVVVKPVALAAPAASPAQARGISLQRDLRLHRPVHRDGARARPGDDLRRRSVSDRGSTVQLRRRSSRPARRTPGSRCSMPTCHPASDLDLYVYRGTTLVGSSGGGTSAEEVNLLNPTAATYTVVVDGYAAGNPSHLHPLHVGARHRRRRQHDRLRADDRHDRRAPARST